MSTSTDPEVHDNYFNCRVRFMFDLNPDGARLYRNMNISPRTRLIDFVPEQAFPHKREDWKATLKEGGFALKHVNGESIDATSYVLPFVGTNPKKEGSVLWLVEQAARDLRKHVFEDASNSPDPFVYGSRISLAGELAHKKSLVGKLAGDEPDASLSCKQRIWNPDTEEWEWEFNYTLTLSGEHDHRYDPRTIRNEFDRSLDDFKPSFRLAARVWKTHPCPPA
ncbi:MAG: hypothetical protein ACI8QC_001869 [Planctomycetota bacterium]|jgi:hypothetical protein